MSARTVGLLAVAGLRGRRRSGLVGTGLVVLLAAIAISAGLVVVRQGAPLLDEVADEADVAHLVLYGAPDAVAAAAAEPDVVASAGPFPLLGGVELPIDGEVVPFQLTALDDPDIGVNRAPMRDGRWLATGDEVVLDHSVSADLGIDVGDELTVRRAGQGVTFVVVGTAVGLTDCFYPQCEPARAWVGSDGLERFGAGDDVGAVGYLRFDDAARADPFVGRLADEGAPGIGGTNSWLDTRDDFLVLDRVFGSFVAAFGLFVLVVAAVIIAGSTAMRVVTRRREIALMGAIGSTPRQVLGALLLEHVVVGAIAVAVGWAIAGVLTPNLQLGIGRTLGAQDPTWSPTTLAICLAVVLGLLVVATVVPARSASRRPVTDVLRDVPPGRVSWISRRVRHLPRRLALLGARDAASQPVRGGLASLAIGVAVVGAVVSTGFVSGIGLVTDDAARAGDPWDVALVPDGADTDEVEALLDHDPDVVRWFSEVDRRSTFRDGAFLSVATGGDPDAAAYDVAAGRMMAGPGEAIVGYGFMERFDIGVGDRVAFLAGPTEIDVEVVGWYRDTEDSGEVLRYRLDDLVAAEPGVRPSIYRLVVPPDVDLGAFAESLATRVGPSARALVLDTGEADLEPLMFVLRAIVVVLFVTAGVNLLSTTVTASRESARRTGVELAVGFTPRQLVTQSAVSGAALGALAALVGVPLGLVLFDVLADAVSTGIGVGPDWLPAPGVTTVAAIAVAAVAGGAALSALAVRRVASRPAAELVRGE